MNRDHILEDIATAKHLCKPSEKRYTSLSRRPSKRMTNRTMRNTCSVTQAEYPSDQVGSFTDKKVFDLYVESILAPTLRPGDVVILDNLPAHRSTVAASILKEIGAWFLFLPKYSPDLNPIEMAFSKLKALIRKVAARTYEELWQAVGHVCSLFNPKECYNFFKAAGYETN